MTMESINIFGAGVIGVISGIIIIAVSTGIENYLQRRRLSQRFNNGK